MTRLCIAGSAMTAMGKRPESSVKSMTAEAVAAALADAGIGAERIEAAWFSNTRQPMLEGQNTIRGQIALREAGIEGIPIANIENACASGSTALLQAATAIQAGLYETVLVVGAEKMFFPDRPEAVAAAFKGGTDIHRIDEIHADVSALAADIIPEGLRDAGAQTRSFFMDSYAALARLHMKTFGTTQAQLAAVAAKNHDHSALNPLAQYRKPMSVEAVLADPLIVWPLTRAMCAPISDGASAIVLSAETALSGEARKRAVTLRGQALLSATTREAADFTHHIGARTARRAYEIAGIDPADIDVAEVHDATAYAEVQQVENLGLCPVGEGGAYAEAGHTRLGGRTPVNPSGGLVSKGHPVGATGLAQIHELVTHLRGEAGSRQVEGARIAVAENGGGFLGVEEGATVVSVLEAPA
ncbi:MAG: thiolase family protein [Pseudomonadota bacterium]|nr:thiolase family protein [Pseudomonadota bacterium]